MSRTLTDYEFKALERKAKAGWASFYAMKNRYDSLGDYVDEIKTRNNELVRKLREGQKDIDVSYLKSQFLDMYDRLKLETECPICFETLGKDNAKLTNCGHLHCRDCEAKLDACSICRKKLYKPKPQN